MKKAIKIPLIALSTLTTQLIMLLGNTSITKSAEHKPTVNNHKKISQTYYDRQIKIENMPSMHNQQKQTELRLNSNSDLRNELNNKDQRNKMTDKCRNIFESQSSFGSGGPASLYYHRVVGDDMYYVYVDTHEVCSYRWTKIGVIGVQRQMHWNIDGTGYPQHIYYRENGELCEYIKPFKGADVKKDCFSYKQY